MGEWAPLPEHVDLLRYEEIQQEWNQRDCRDVSPVALGKPLNKKGGAPPVP